MKRLLVLFAVLVPLSLFVVGCGQSGGSSGKSAPMPPKEVKFLPPKGVQVPEGMKGKAMPGAPGEAAKK